MITGADIRAASAARAIKAKQEAEQVKPLSPAHLEAQRADARRQQALAKMRAEVEAEVEAEKIAEADSIEIRKAASRPSDRRHALARGAALFDLLPCSWADAADILLPISAKRAEAVRTAAGFVADQITGGVQYSREEATVTLWKHGGVLLTTGRRPSFKYSVGSEHEVDARHKIITRQFAGIMDGTVTLKAAAGMIGSKDDGVALQALRHMAWTAALKSEPVAPVLLGRRLVRGAPLSLPSQEQSDTFAALLRTLVFAVDAVVVDAAKDIKAGSVGAAEALALEAALPAPSQWTDVLADLTLARALGAPREAERAMERILDAVLAHGGAA